MTLDEVIEKLETKADKVRTLGTELGLMPHEEARANYYMGMAIAFDEAVAKVKACRKENGNE